MKNEIFGMLTAIKPAYKERGHTYWLCKCECGNNCYRRASTMKPGRKMNCGCSHNKTHGMSKHRLYHVWVAMTQRCSNPNNKRWSDYGGRGISVCERWLDVRLFIKDVESTYEEGLQLDRIDNDGGYSPENCRWVTPEANCNNRRTSRRIETPHGRMTIAEAARAFNISYAALHNRLTRGVDMNSLFRPVCA